MENLGNWRRDHYCGDVTKELVGSEVTCMGWVQRRRDHGGLIFVDLRDRTGVVQVVFNPEDSTLAHEKAHTVRSEFVLAVKGKVTVRPDGTENPDLKTGAVEVRAGEFKILAASEVPPFMIDDETDAGEELRLKYSYLDLRRAPLRENLMLRHRVTAAVREYMDKEGFLDIETPVLTKSTPEGARDFLVPSRLNAGHFYALPQSPQIFKQILMISGMDRYYQIVKCFRDEDLRADRQPEFTQIDIEMSFVGAEDVMEAMEGLVRHVFKEAKGVDLGSFERLTFDDAVGRYGLDAPDTRFGMELCDLTDIVKDTGFKVFASVAKSGGLVKAINATGCASFSRKELDGLTDFAATYGGKGLAWVKLNADGWQSPIAKFFTDDEKAAIEKATGAKEGDLMLFSADKAGVVNTVLGRLRVELGRRLKLIPSGAEAAKDGGFNFVWVTDFPLLEYSEGEKRHVAIHHPFTAPLEEDMELLDKEPGKVRSAAYDLVLNGVEIGGGSIRIHRRDLQAKIFGLLGISDEEAKDRFGFLLDALSFGAPPHGGIAFGLDRIVALMAGCDSIRDVMAFPKTQKAFCLLSEAPSEVDKKQLDELALRIKKAKGAG